MSLIPIKGTDAANDDPLLILRNVLRTQVYRSLVYYRHRRRRENKKAGYSEGRLSRPARHELDY